MANKSGNIHHRVSYRLKKWDYGWDGAYFVTICTKDRECYFGDVVNGKMKMSEVGIIANVLWDEIRNHFQNVLLDAYVVMPNHVHGIITLFGNENDNVNIDDVDGVGGVVGTRHALSLHAPEKTIGQQRFQHPGKNTISTIIGSYKSAVTKHSHRLGYEFAWQSRFYDHVIRDNKSFENIINYITNNPINWNYDRFRS